MKKCEHCNNEINGIGHSCLIVLQKVTKDGYTFFQCNDGQEVDFHNWQHWHCCHQHMQRGIVKCLWEHHAEDKLQSPLPGNIVNLHKVVLRSNLTCRYCVNMLTDVAYRICITMATPYNHVPDESQNELGEWCCSLDHAIRSAIVTINMMEERHSHAELETRS